MWLMVLFDLPTDTKKLRKDYTNFRKALLTDGFSMMQYSVYIRHCASLENALVHEKRVGNSLPPEGEVRTLLLTDKQYGKMRTFYGRKRKKLEQAPLQLELL